MAQRRGCPAIPGDRPATSIYMGGTGWGSRCHSARCHFPHGRPRADLPAEQPLATFPAIGSRPNIFSQGRSTEIPAGRAYSNIQGALPVIAAIDASTQMTVQTIVMVVIGVITTGMVPWAYLIERRLARLEARLGNGFSKRIEKHSDLLHDVQNEIHVIETKMATLPPDEWRNRILENEKQIRDLSRDGKETMRRLIEWTERHDKSQKQSE